MNKQQFGQYIRESRTNLNLTQQQLADALYIDVTAVSKWERGITYPDITLIPDICKILQVNEHELIASCNDTEARRIRKDAETYNKTKNTVFLVFSILYATAVLTCFIVNLAADKTLSWFWIVLTGCICGFTFCPTVMRFFDRKLTVFVGSTLLSLCVLYLVCSLVTGVYWCFTAMIGTVLGYFAFFFPFLYFRQKKYVKEKTYRVMKKSFVLLYGIGLSLLTVILLIVVNIYVPYDVQSGIQIAVLCFSLFIAYGLIALLPIEKLCILGLGGLLTGGFCLLLNQYLPPILDGNGVDVFRFNFGDWSHYTSENTAFIILLSFVGIGLLLLGLGMVNVIKKR